MVLGKEPVPFYQAARKYVLSISCVLAVVLMLLALVLICLARINTDRYFVMVNANMSYFLYPIGILLGELFHSQHKVTMVLLIITHKVFRHHEGEFVTFEKQRLWEDLLTVSLLFPTLTLTQICGHMMSESDDILYGYVLTVFIFVLGSMVFLGFCGTNTELLQAIYVNFSGDEISKKEYEACKLVELSRYEERKTAREIEQEGEDNARRRGDTIEAIFVNVSRNNRIEDLDSTAGDVELAQLP
ncbi:uncharacterized protein LOC144439800 [Glandiceps talaboti]